MGAAKIYSCAAAFTLAGLWLAAVSCSQRISLDQVLAGYRENATYSELLLRYPQDGVLFPPELAAPTFYWEDKGRADCWAVLLECDDAGGRMSFLAEQASWTPDRESWATLKSRSREKPARLTVLGFRRAEPGKILSRGSAGFCTSKDPVGAPLFYREVNLPFLEAVKDPSRIRWRFGTIDSPQPPPVVLDNLPVCGNCHSFSQDGGTLGMDVDYANNKGSYVITPVAAEMTLSASNIITWDSFRREDKEQTFGLLSQVSPDGRTVISTVKDKSVFVATKDLAFSQLFFPIKGILVVYHRDTGTFEALPGADDPQYVQSNPTWSADGKQIVFARAKAYQLKNQNAQGKLLLSEEDCAEFLREGQTFQFDLYRIPYNEGKGGTAEPVPGASKNGRSNFFPRFSPDGKWLVFCQARSFMLLQPDSELFIMPAEGGEPRRLRANTARMNSWHSWSPNSRWLVFSSKANSPYTQLFLAHIDEHGESTPPVVLSNFTSPDRAANIPEFVNTRPGAIAKIRERFLDDYSHARAAYVLENMGDIDRAIAEYGQALKIDPANAHAHQRLGYLLYQVKQDFKEGLAHTAEALRLNPNDGCAHYDLGLALKHQGQLQAAIPHFTSAVRLLPSGFDRRYNPGDMSCELADALLLTTKAPEAAQVLKQLLRLDPEHARAHYLMALAAAAQGQLDPALAHYAAAMQKEPALDTSPELHLMLSVHHARAGNPREARAAAEKSLQLARARGDANLIQAVSDQLEQVRTAR